MKKCIHPNVVRLIEVIDDPNARKIYMGRTTHSCAALFGCGCGECGQRTNFFFSCPTCNVPNTPVLEYMEGGEVRWKDTEDKPILPLQDARTIFRDVVLGLEYRKVYHAHYRSSKHFAPKH